MSQIVLIIRNIQPVYTAKIKLSVAKHSLLLSDFSKILIFKWKFRKIHKGYEISCSWGGTDRERDGHDGSNSCISQFWNSITNATRISRFIDWHVQNSTVPCRSQELLSFLYLIYPSLPHFYTNYYSIFPHLILPPIFLLALKLFISLFIYNSLSWNSTFLHSLCMLKPT